MRQRRSNSRPNTPLSRPARVEFDFDASGRDPAEVALEPSPEDVDQSPAYNPTEPDPIPDDDFDQSRSA